ncbi:glycosyltransferase family 4 protein [Candidatus Poriferisocius sp.]|uniref:glycosyltransferase family 4 protein n=1 Tax=Candidatus Poriferisocius sp. TaxID=3101276 RepID=UPI003B0271E1
MSAGLRILVLCPHYEPDTAPTGEIMTILCRHWVERGHRVEIITSLPWYRDHAVAAGWSGRLLRTQHEVWGRIRRWHPFPSRKGRLVARAVSFAGFTVLAGADAVATSRRCDVVFAMSPPLTLGVAGRVAARMRRVPLVFNVQDVFPDVAVETGVLRGSRGVAAARRLERRVYRWANAVTVLSEGMAGNVRAKLDPGDHESKVVVIPNVVDVDRITPADRHNRYRAELGSGGGSSGRGPDSAASRLGQPGAELGSGGGRGPEAIGTVVMYAGNLGYSQSLELVVAAAERFAGEGRDDVRFVVNGDGVARPLVAEAARHLDNLTLVGWQPPERLGEVLAAADLHLILLRKGLGASSVPSKVYSVLAAGRPMVAAVDRGSEIERLLVAAGAGRTVDPDDVDAFCSTVAEMVDDPSGLAEMGRRARAYAEQIPSPGQVADRYLELFQRLARP